MRSSIEVPAFAGTSCRARNARAGGFTLIEVMVALAVFGLAVLALVRLEGAGLRGAGLADEALSARLVARNAAIEAYTDARPPAPGRTAGSEASGGRTWTWARQVSALGDAGVMRIDVAVTDRRGQLRERLTMVRPPDAPATPAPEPAPTPTDPGAGPT